MTDKRKVLEVDSRRRVSLGKLGSHDMYLAHTEVDGTIILTPAVILPVVNGEKVVPAMEVPGE